ARLARVLGKTDPVALNISGSPEVRVPHARAAGYPAEAPLAAPGSRHWFNDACAPDLPPPLRLGSVAT
ncbi:MAG: hypothetical protein ACKODB_01915, partial [Betaproteobacteria bacterium]